MSKNKFFSLVFILFAWLTSGSAIAADWSAGFSGKGGGTYEITSTAVDGSGNIYLAGHTYTSITMGSFELNRIGNQDAFVVKLSSTGTVVWLKSFGGSGANTSGNSVAVDSAGNVYLGGHFNAAHLTTPALTKIGGQDAFAIKLDSSGNTTWAKNHGGSGGGFTYGQSIAVDGPNGNVYLAGYFAYGSLTSLGLSQNGSEDGFAVKLNSSGATTWAKSYYGNSATTVDLRSIAVDGPGGNVYLGGSFRNSNPTVLTVPELTKIGTRDALAIKLNSSGTTVWAKNFGGASAEAYAYSIKVDGPGNVYLGGYFSNASLSNPSLTKIGNNDAFAFKLDSDGEIANGWAKNYGGSGANARAYGIAVDSAGDVYLGGYFGNADLSTPALTQIGNNDAFAFKLASLDGTTTWTKKYGGSGANVYGNSIAVDSTGTHVYLGGTFEGANLTTPALTRIGAKDAFAIKLDATGDTTLSLNPGGAVVIGIVNVTSSAVDSTGNVYITGNIDSTTNTFTLGSTTLTRIGNQDAFAAMLDSGGTVLWAKNFGGIGAVVNGKSIAVDSTGNVYVGGYYNSAELTTPPLTNRLGNTDAFAIQLDSVGNITWSQHYGGTGANTYGNSIAVNGTGVYLGGSFGGNHLTNPGLTKIGNDDAFAIKLDSTTGTPTWAKNFGGSAGSTYGNSIAVDSAGNVYLGGHFRVTNLTDSVAQILQTRIGARDAFAIKLNSSGTTVWGKNFGGSSASAYGNSVAVDSAGNVYLGGSYESSRLTTPPDLTPINASDSDAFAFKLDSTGTTVWARNFGGSAGAYTYGNSIAVDSTGNVYLGGYFTSDPLTTPELAQIGSRDAFAFKLNTAGTTTWSANFGGTGATATGNSIAVDGSGNVYLAGTFGTASLTTPPLTLSASQHGFVLKQLIPACGSANATTPLVTSAPSANLCATGTAGSVTASNSAYTWSCSSSGVGGVSSCSASRGYTVAPNATGSGSITPSTPQVVAYNATTPFTAAPASGYFVNTWGGSCGGTASGTGNVNYSTSAVVAGCSVTVDFLPVCGSANGAATAFIPGANLCSVGTASTVTPGTSSWAWSCTGATNATCSAPYSPVNGGGGTVGAIQTSGTNGWQIDQAASGFVSLPAPAPAGVTFPGGATKVVLITGTAGTSATVTLRFSSIPAGAQLYKYGKENATDVTAKWFPFPATIDTAAGTVTYTLTDGQRGDNDWTANSVIDDPVALASLVSSIPTLSEWGVIILSTLLALFGLVRMRRRQGFTA
jgi:hypothetical protein